MNTDVMFSSKTDLWSTPPTTFRGLDAEFGFTLDVCATDDNAKCPDYFTEADDGLAQEWHGCVWMNPPYGRGIGRWVDKARRSVADGRAEVAVCLLPARTDTAWWHDIVIPHGETRFIRGRLKFGNAKAGAPFPSAVVIFRKQPREAPHAGNR